jgi:hypothetical protein
MVARPHEGPVSALLNQPERGLEEVQPAAPPHNGALIPVRLPILMAAISNQPAYNGTVFCSSFAYASHLKEVGASTWNKKLNKIA